VDANAHPGFDEAERRGAACDTRADDRDVDPSVVTGEGRQRSRIFEPVRVQEVER
jgi:hypothetical protein